MIIGAIIKHILLILSLEDSQGKYVRKRRKHSYTYWQIMFIEDKIVTMGRDT